MDYIYINTYQRHPIGGYVIVGHLPGHIRPGTHQSEDRIQSRDLILSSDWLLDQEQNMSVKNTPENTIQYTLRPLQTSGHQDKKCRLCLYQIITETAVFICFSSSIFHQAFIYNKTDGLFFFLPKCVTFQKCRPVN